MAGYVAPPRPSQAGRPTAPGDPRTFRDAVLSLPQLASSVAERLQFFAFGKTIRPLSIAELGAASNPRFYSDPDSRIQDVLARMDALPADEIGILLTDLFLTGEEVFGGAAAIRAPLARILDSGRSIALAGIRSGFSGTVYDIPGVRTYTGATERPFYLLATGPGPVVSRLLRRLEVELLAPLAPAADGEPRQHAVIFQHDPYRAGPAHLPLLPSEKAELAPALAPDLGPDVSRVRFLGTAGLASAALPLAALADPHALLPDRFEVAERLWAEPLGRDARTACGERWVAVHSLPKLARVLPDGPDGAPVLQIGGAALGRVTPGVTFLLHARVNTASLSDAPAKTAWVRAWNLEARDAEAFVSSRPRLFRTLNLREIVSMLEGLVRDRLAPRPIGEAVLAFQIPRR